RWLRSRFSFAQTICSGPATMVERRIKKPHPLATARSSHHRRCHRAPLRSLTSNQKREANQHVLLNAFLDFAYDDGEDLPRCWRISSIILIPLFSGSGITSVRVGTDSPTCWRLFRPF